MNMHCIDLSNTGKTSSHCKRAVMQVKDTPSIKKGSPKTVKEGWYNDQKHLCFVEKMKRQDKDKENRGRV